jgi:small subunit ribosomal protein S16
LVKIRMKRMGRRHRPFYRINVMDTRSPRDGRVIEELGFYDPTAKEQDKQIKLNEERIRYWLGQGAQTSETMGNILRKNGIEVKKK